MRDLYQAHRSEPFSHMTFYPWWLTGLLMSIGAGMVLLLFKVLIALILHGTPWQPFYDLAVMVLQVVSWPQTATLYTVVPVALAVHIALSMIYGLFFTWITHPDLKAERERATLLVTATFWGACIWAAHWYVLTPTLPGYNNTWFTTTPPAIQFVAYTVFYGTTLGVLLVRRTALLPASAVALAAASSSSADS